MKASCSDEVNWMMMKTRAFLLRIYDVLYIFPMWSGEAPKRSASTAKIVRLLTHNRRRTVVEHEYLNICKLVRVYACGKHRKLR
jgi:hypothetical protein